MQGYRGGSVWRPALGLALGTGDRLRAVRRGRARGQGQQPTQPHTPPPLDLPFRVTPALSHTPRCCCWLPAARPLTLTCVHDLDPQPRQAAAQRCHVLARQAHRLVVVVGGVVWGRVAVV